jgi:hypothetical protein
MKSSTWFLVIAVALVGYVIWSGGERRFAGQRPAAPARGLDYDVVAVSQGLSAEARALDLADDLDVALLPEIGKQAIRDAAGRGLREQAFLEAVLRDVSDRVREISTIDLNGDGTTDPVLVRPEPAADEGYVLLSLRVPAPEAYPLPAARDTAAWQAAETVEVATLTVSLNREQLAVEAAGNPQVYPQSGGQHYVAYDRSPGFLETYFAIRMLDWMFFPSYWGFWGPGWGYGAYRPLPVADVRGDRAGTLGTRGYAPGTATDGPVVRGRSGAAPASRYQRAYSRKPPRSLSRLQASRRFAQRQPGDAVRSGGFGRGERVSGAPTAAPSRRYGSARGTVRGFGGYSRGTARGFSRGMGGRALRPRGFGGFGRGLRLRR